MVTPENIYMVDDLKKISLPTAADPPMTRSVHHSGKKFPIKFLVIPLGVIAVIIVLFVIMLLPLKGVYADAQVLIASGRVTAAAVKSQDLVKTKAALADTRQKLETLKSDYNKALALKYVPLVGLYISDGEHAIAAGEAGLDAADQAMAALEPNADLLGLKGKSSFVSGTADDRIQMAVKTMNALTPKINEMAVSVAKLRTEIDAIDPGHYPEHIGNLVVKSQLVGIQGTIDNAANIFVNAQPLLTNLPKLLGDPKE